MANGDSTSPKDVSAPTEPRLVTVQLLPVHNPRNDNRATATRVTGTIQIASAVTTAVAFVIGIFFTADSWLFNNIRCPFAITFVVFCVSGVLATGAAVRRSPCLITMHMVAAMFSTVAAIFIGFLFAGALFVELRWLITPKEVEADEAGFIQPKTPICLYFNLSFASIVLLAVMALMILVQFVASVWGSSLAARTVCCPNKADVGYKQMEAGSSVVTLARKPYIIVPVPRPDITKEAGPLPEKTVPDDSKPASEK